MGQPSVGPCLKEVVRSLLSGDGDRGHPAVVGGDVAVGGCRWAVIASLVLGPTAMTQAASDSVSLPRRGRRVRSRSRRRWRAAARFATLPTPD